MDYLNIAGYAFFSIEKSRLEVLKAELKTHCIRLKLKGSILIAEEGANIFLAGTKHAINEMIESLETLYHFPKIPFKKSLSEYQPFRKILVKIKKEIISMGCPEIQPEHTAAPYVSPEVFKQWLDEGRDLLILDTRNDYEVALGTFVNNHSLNIKNFRDFPKACSSLPDSVKDKTIVAHCTGGIRAEKAAAYLIHLGFKNVFQLQGGILNYFEKCGNAHYTGECFVFDQRVALDEKLSETKTVQCFACRMPVTQDEQKSPLYQIAESCPSCSS